VANSSKHSDSQVCSKIIQCIVHSNITGPDTDDNDDNNDLFLLTASRGTSPVDSNANDTDIDADVVYEVDDSDDNDIVPEKLAESAQAELSMQSTSYYSHTTHLLFPDRLAKDWVSPIYVFFKRMPRIEYVDTHRVHVFECVASHCKGKHGRDVRRFLDTGDAKSTSGLHRHAKMCWGEEAVNAADNTKDLDGARTVLAKAGLKRNGSITEAFKCINKEKVSYSHRQHTYTETRYVHVTYMETII
jgi:hypothetical protein